MALTSIGFQKTPARPVEITFDAEGGLPNPNQTINLIGHMAATGMAGSGSALPYVVTTMANVADPTAAATEANAKFGAGSELAKMVIACVQANAAVGASSFPQLTCTPLLSTDADFGPLNGAGIPAALAATEKFEAEFLVSPYDSQNQTLTAALIAQAERMSGATRVQNGQYGTIAIAHNKNITDPTTYFKYDTQYFSGSVMRDTSSSAYSLGELAAAYAGILGANAVPFNPVDGLVVGNVAAPTLNTDWFTVGVGLDTEAALNRGYSPLRVLPNGTVAVVRSVTARLTQNADGVTAVTAYYDVQDFQVLYFFRKAIAARFNQPDFTNVKASQGEAKLARGEVIRLASAFEDQGMFQNVAGLAPLVKVERNASDRHRFDIFVPVNVVPGLHVIATNVQAGTIGDVFTV